MIGRMHYLMLTECFDSCRDTPEYLTLTVLLSLMNDLVTNINWWDPNFLQYSNLIRKMVAGID
jgi:hypothetical protein